MRELSGKCALITGAAGGIGAAMAEEFAASGMKLVLTDIDGARLDGLAGRLRGRGAEVLSLARDVGSLARWEEIVAAAEARFGAVHLLCNNAGITAMGWGIDDLPPDVWDLVLRVDLTSAYYGIRTVVPRMKAHGLGGHIVNTASMSGLRAMENHAVYVAAKAGLIGLSEAIRLELAPHGIGVTVLCPGAVATEIVGNSDRVRGDAGAPPAPGTVVHPLALAGAADPRDVALAVRRAVEEETFYLVTPNNAEAHVRARNEELMVAFGKAGVKQDW